MLMVEGPGLRVVAMDVLPSPEHIPSKLWLKSRLMVEEYLPTAVVKSCST